MSLLAVLVAAAQLAGAAQITQVYGPLRLRGSHPQMLGPYMQSSRQFDRPGWITRFETWVVDKDGRPVDQSVFCHSVFEYYPVPGGPPSLHVTTEEGKNVVAFPSGYGVRVDTAPLYLLEMMLQSDDPSVDRELYFKVTWDVTYEGDGPPLKSLESYKVKILAGEGRSPAAMTDGQDWWVPPGRHEYSARFLLPYSGEVHFIAPHVHRYASVLRLKDEQTGHVLYEDRVRAGKAFTLERIPVFSGDKGIPLVEGRPYLFEVVYDNPLKKPVEAMANLRLFIVPAAQRRPDVLVLGSHPPLPPALAARALDLSVPGEGLVRQLRRFDALDAVPFRWLVLFHSTDTFAEERSFLDHKLTFVEGAPPPPASELSPTLSERAAALLWTLKFAPAKNRKAFRDMRLYIVPTPEDHAFAVELSSHVAHAAHTPWMKNVSVSETLDPSTFDLPPRPE